jgi:hypothetical protein
MQHQQDVDTVIDAVDIIRLSGPYSSTPGLNRQYQGPDVFTELSRKFEMFVQLLSYVAEELSARAVRDDSSLLDVYERWLKVQSDSLTELLLARGILPQRKSPGLH